MPHPRRKPVWASVASFSREPCGTRQAHPMLRRILQLFRPKQVSTAVHDLLENAAAQRAVFRIEAGEGSGPRRYFIAADISPGRLELEPRGLRLEGMHHWRGQRFAFRFILCSRECGRTQLFEFSSKVASIDARRDRLCLDFPDAVKSLERRQNVRIALQMRHMPRIGLWPVLGGDSGKTAPRIMSRPILDMGPGHSSIGLTIRNLSSGGIRLSFKKSEYAEHQGHLEAGRRLLVELSFSGKAFPSSHLFRIICCVRNVIPAEGNGRVEVGVQFLALHQQGRKPAWKNVEKGGVDDIGRLVHQFQVEYYKEIKKRLDRMPVAHPRKASQSS
ncbi:hypothetical protein GD604_01540 [Desulfolutivibrio sulfoxidireducens]|nr:hypothetical protein GD604_01540 [Desulfolutivibrio sulfoxidireducens]